MRWKVIRRCPLVQDAKLRRETFHGEVAEAILAPDVQTSWPGAGTSNAFNSEQTMW